MVSSFFIVSLAAMSAYGAPLYKRIAQNIPESTAKWEQACLAAGGGLKCNPASVTAFTTLLAAAGPCEQQDAADAMIDLAKTLQNNAELIKLTQIFVQQPRNSPNSVSIPYCQEAPKNAELAGLFQCQFEGSNPTTFVGGVQVGGQGTVPFGLSAPLSPPGSCPANPTGPIKDGIQLVTITQDPGEPSNDDGVNNGGNGSAPDASSISSAPTGAAETPDTSSSAVATAVSSSSAPPAIPTGGNGGDFKAQNGRDAQALNAKFAELTADSACTVGENACIEGGFAQCVGGKFVVTQCAGGLKCFALPLVNSRGTSITCDTEEDALARIAASGATGGLTGDGSAEAPSEETEAPSAPSEETGLPSAPLEETGAPSAPSEETGAPSAPSEETEAPSAPLEETGAPSAPSEETEAPSAPSSGSASIPSGTGSTSDFKAQNGRDAQALNAKFATLSDTSACNAGENACVDGGFAQCVNGKFVVTKCSGGLQCFALPLVNKPGTSITCDTEADAIARIAASGVTGGLAGK